MPAVAFASPPTAKTESEYPDPDPPDTDNDAAVINTPVIARRCKEKDKTVTDGGCLIVTIANAVAVAAASGKLSAAKAVTVTAPSCAGAASVCESTALSVL